MSWKDDDSIVTHEAKWNDGTVPYGKCGRIDREFYPKFQRTEDVIDWLQNNLRNHFGLHTFVWYFDHTPAWNVFPV